MKEVVDCIYFIVKILGKFGSTAVFGLLYLYTAELYPTEIRGTAIGLCCMLSRLGGIAAPQVMSIYLYTLKIYKGSISGPQHTNKVHQHPIPFFIQVSLSLTKEWAMFVLGLCSLMAGILTLALPETLGTLLVERIEEVHELKDDGKPFLSCWSKS